MQRGAYEAMAVGKPLVTSDWPILRSNFNKGTVHANNNAGDIAIAIEKAISESASLTREMRTLSIEQDRVFSQGIDKLKRRLTHERD